MLRYKELNVNANVIVKWDIISKMTKKRDRKIGLRYGKSKASRNYWIYGKHASSVAIDNPNREILRILVTENIASQLVLPNDISRPNVEIVEAKTISQFVHDDAVHQGIAVQLVPLEEYVLNDVLDDNRPLILLDQVTDPHNVGAIMRSAAAFNAAGVIVTQNNSPSENATIAKAACGAIEVVPLVKVTNLANTIDEIKRADYWVWGMDGTAKQTIREAKPDNKTAIVMGAEGAGLRRLTAEKCDLLVKLPMNENMESLNVSNAAAIALYEIFVS